MHKRILTLLLITAVSITAFLSLLLTLAPIQAAPLDSISQSVPNASGSNGTEYFTAFLTGDQEVPAVSTDAGGVSSFTLVNSTTLSYEVAVKDIISITAAHIHMGAIGVNGPVVFPLYTGSGDFDPDNPISGTLMLTAEQANDLRTGNYYVNVHTAANPSGEIRGQIGDAQTTAYQTFLSGANETPVVNSRASGQAFLTLSADMTQLYYRVYVADIEDITAAHIHEAAPGQNGPVIFPLYTGSGDFDPQHPVSGVLSPTLSQVAAMLAGDFYINVHTAENPAGEIRGQIGPFTPSPDSHAVLNGSQEVGPVDTDGVGIGRFNLSADMATLSTYLAVDNIMNITAAHLHTGQPGENGSVAHTLYGGGGSFGPGNPVSGTLTFNAQNVLDLISGNYYANVHTTDNPSGEIRGQVIGVNHFAAALAGDHEVPAVDTAAGGTAYFGLNEDASKLYYRVMVSDIPMITASHIHRAPSGENGPVVFTLFSGGGDFDENNPISGMIDVTDDDIFDLLAGGFYVNVHTTANPAGEIRGQMTAFEPAAHHEANLSGDQEVPPVPTSATGQADFTLDSVRHSLNYYVTVNDIVSINAAHIHKAPVGQNGPVIFGLFAGDGAFDPDHPLGSGVQLNAENLVDLLSGYYYVNVHTAGYPSGEIRGQIGSVMHLISFPIITKE